MRLYHGTSCKKVPSILKHGLLVECEHVWGKRYKHPPGWKYPVQGKLEPRLTRCGVYLTEKLHVAQRFAEDATTKFGGKPCVVTVKCLADKAKLGGDGYGYKMTDKAVPTRCVRRYLRGTNTGWEKDD